MVEMDEHDEAKKEAQMVFKTKWGLPPLHFCDIDRNWSSET